MHLQKEIGVTLASEYFNQIDVEINYEETGDSNMVTSEEADAISEILTCEVSIYALRTMYGVCGSLADHMGRIRRKLINSYESNYGKKYIEYNDFY